LEIEFIFIDIFKLRVRRYSRFSNIWWNLYLFKLFKSIKLGRM